MASFINSIRNITSDPWWFVKVSVLSAVVFFVLDEGYYQYENPNYIVAYVLLGVLGMGFASVLMHRNINNKSPILPSLFCIPEFIAKAICSSIVVVPGTILLAVVVNAIYTNFEFEPFVSFVVYCCVTLFFVPFIFVPAVLYSVNGKLVDSFRFNLIYTASGNYTVQFAGYVIQYMLIMGFSTYLVYFIILEMLGDHVGLLILESIVIVLSFLSVFSFSSDLYMDVIPEIPAKPKKKKRKF